MRNDNCVTLEIPGISEASVAGKHFYSNLTARKSINGLDKKPQTLLLFWPKVFAGKQKH